MDPSTSSTTPRRFSNEIFALILGQADVGTLAGCSLVCLAFLEISAPLLYRDIVIDKEGQIQTLFCDQHSPSSSAASPYLSLTQIKTFTILHENSSPLNLSKSRFPNGLPLQIDLLALRPTFVHRSSNEFFFMLRTKHVNRMEVCLAFDPISFIAQYPTTEPFPNDEEGESQGEPTYRWQGFALRQEEAHRPLPWSRLEEVLYDGCYFVFGPVGDDASGFAPLSFESSSSKELRITYDLSSLEDALLFASEAFVDLDEAAVGEGEVYFLDLGVTMFEIVVKDKATEECLKAPLLEMLPERHETKLLVTIRASQ